MASSSSDAAEPTEGEIIDVTVKTLDGHNRTFNVSENLTVKQFKEKISSSINIPATTQRLIFQGRVLQDEKPIKDYKINGKVIHVVQRAPPSNLSGPPPDPSPPPHTHGDPGMFDVQIHMGRPHNVASPREARARVRQAEFNLGLVNDALNLLEERTNISHDSLPAADESEIYQPSTSQQEESMEANSEQPSTPSQPQGEQGTREAPALQAAQLADFLDRVLRTNNRMAPHLRLYRNYLRNQESYSSGTLQAGLNEDGTRAQEVVNRVSEALHAMSHLMHSLSDVMVDMATEPPRQCLANSAVGMPGTASLAIPIQMNFRARQGSLGNRQQRQQGTSTSTPTSTSTSSSSSSSSSTSSSTTTGQPATGQTPSSTTGSGPAGTANVPGSMPAGVSTGGLGGATTMQFDLGQGGFQIAGMDPSMMVEVFPTGVAVHDIRVTHEEVPLDGANTTTSTPGPQSTTSTSTNPASATTTTTNSTTPNTSTTGPTTTTTQPPTSTASSGGPQPQQQQTPGGPPRGPNPFSGGSFTFNPAAGGPGNVRMAGLPNIPGLPAGMLQNILGSIITQHGARHGHPVQVNVIQSRGPHPHHHHHHHHPPPQQQQQQTPRRFTQDLPVDEVSPRSDASQQTPTSMDASTATRNNAATNTASGRNFASTNAATNTASAGNLASSNAATNTAGNINPAGVGTNTDPGMGTNSRSTNTPRGAPHFHIHHHHQVPPRGFATAQGGVGRTRPSMGLGRPPVPGMRGYQDPYLWCNSVHYSSESARRAMRNNQNTTGAAGQPGNGATGVPNLSTMVSGMVGDMIEQVGNALNPNNAGPRPTMPTPGAPGAQQPTTNAGRGGTAPTGGAGGAGPRPGGAIPGFEGLPANMMQMLSGMMGGGGAGGLDISQMMSAIMNPMFQPPGGGPQGPPPDLPLPNPGSEGTLDELLVQFRSVTGGPTDSDSHTIISGALESIAPQIQVRDLASLIAGNHIVLAQLRPHLRRYVTAQVERLGSLDGVVAAILEDLRPGITYMQSLVEVRQGVDMTASMLACLKSHLQTILLYLHNGDQGAPDDEYSRTVYGMGMRTISTLLAVCRHCLRDGDQGLDRMWQAYVPSMMNPVNPVNPVMTQWMVSSMQSVMGSILTNHPVPQGDIEQYIRGPSSVERPASSSDSTPRPPREEAVTTAGGSSPMEVEESPTSLPPKAKVARTGPGSDTSNDEFVDASDSLPISPNPTPAPARAATTPVRTGAREGIVLRGSTLTPSPGRVISTVGSRTRSGAVTNGSDDWQSVITQEWIPVIEQDVVRQSTQRPQPPFSDAYIQGLPAKRRRMMSLEHAGEMGNMSGYLPGALSRAARAAGAQPISSPDNLAQEAANDTELQDQLEEEVTSALGSRLSQDTDYNNGERFPHSKEYFHKSRRP